MKRARITLVACSVFLVFAAALAAAPAAPPVPRAAANPADAAFLASLTPLAPEALALPGIGIPAPSPRGCGAGFCAEARQQCQLDCAPCTGSVTGCVISICDYTCWCQC